MSSNPSRTLRDDLRELQARLAVRTAELDQVQKALADQEATLQRLATRRLTRASLIRRYRRDLILSACLFAGIVVLLIAQSLSWFVLLSAAAFLLSSGACVLCMLHEQRRIVSRATETVAEQPSVRLFLGVKAGQSSSRGTVDFRRSVKRLAIYRPFGPDDTGGDFARRQLILTAAYENGGRLNSCAECREICQARWGFELETDEIYVAIRRLIADKQLLQEATHFRLSPSSSDEMTERVRISSELEATAFSEWEATVQNMAPSLDYRQMTQLREDLTVWIQQIIVEHGVEAALVLHPEQELFRSRLEVIRAVGFEFLPMRDSHIMLERPHALRAFLDDMTSIQRRYFYNLVSAAYFVSVITLEPATLSKMQELLNGQRLYLDTNVVYSLLKLNGPRAYANTQRILRLSRQLGYQVCVTPWTITEFEESVRARLRFARRSSLQTPADVARQATDDDAGVFDKALRGMQRETGISFDDFFVLHEQIRSLLINDDVEVVAEGCPVIDADDERVKEQIAALERVGPAKSRVVHEHDVKHRLLIERLRGEDKRRFSNAGYLVLTTDQTLVRYAEAGRKRPGDIPFAVSFNGWAHIVRSLTPRTDDYDMTMVHILNTPSLRRPDAVSQADVIEAIARIDAYQRHSEMFGMRALLDTALSDAREEVGGVPNDSNASMFPNR